MTYSVAFKSLSMYMYPNGNMKVGLGVNYCFIFKDKLMIL